MAIAYSPGEEIPLELDSPTQFFSKAMSWREQREFREKIAELKRTEGDETGTADDKQTELALELICGKVSRTEPVIEVTPDGIANALDYRTIWHLLTAISYNMTAEDKKKLE